MSTESLLLETQPKHILLSDLPYENLQEYLESSSEFYAVNEIPLQEGYYDAEKNEFVIEMEVPLMSQAYKGYSHGGYISTLLDTGAGMIAFIKSSESGKSVVTKNLSIDFRRPFAIGTQIRIVGKINSTADNGMETTVTIVQLGEKEKDLARATAVMRYVKEKPINGWNTDQVDSE